MITTEHKAEIPIDFYGFINFIRVKYPKHYDMENYEWISLILRGYCQTYIDNFDDFIISSAEEECSDHLYDNMINNTIISSLQRDNGFNEILTLERFSKI